MADQTNRDRTEEDTAVLTKHHGLGNDFLIAVGQDRTFDAADAIALCDRRTGFGADGLIVAIAIDAGGTEPVRKWRMTLWNADGSRAEISGNGLRCLGQAIAEHEALDPAIDQELSVETDAGTRSVLIKAVGPVVAEPAVGRNSMVRVGMGNAVDGPAASSRWGEVGIDVTDQRGVDIGNPHLVGFVDSLGPADMAVIGPVVEADYPAGVNVHLVEVMDSEHLDLRVWERGAGVTQACGSGACAAAWAVNAAGLVGRHVTVTMPGGQAEVELTSEEIFLTGPAVRVGEVRLDG